MASSELTLAQILAGASGQQQDPALLAAMPQMQMGQHLVGQGLSDAPTNKWGALSRLAQVLSGTYIMNKGQEGIQDIINQRGQQTSDAFKRMSGDVPTGGMPPPTQAVPPGATPTGGFSGNLAQAESGGRPGVVNAGGYSGMFQMGAPRASDLGVYTPAQGEDLKSNQWTGSFNIPGFPQVKTHSDFLASPGAQHAVQGMHIANIDQTIANTPGAANMTQDGLRAVAHLGGNEGMQKFVATGGKYNPADANGTKLSDYYSKFSQGNKFAGPGAPADSAAPQPATGYPPNFQRGLDMMHRAQQEMVANPYNQAIQRAGQMKIQEAAEIMKLEQYHQTAPGVYQSSTGKPVFAPTPRMATDYKGNIHAVGPGGVSNPIGPQNVSGVTGNTPESNAMRAIAELGPKVNAGTASPQEIANYHVAITTYQHFKTVTDPATQSLVSVPENPLPPGMSGGGSHSVTPLTGSARGPAAAQDIVQAQGKTDADTIAKEAAEVTKDHAILGTSQTIRSMMPQVAQGTFAEQKLRAAQIFQSLGVKPETAQAWLGTNAAPGEILQKKLFELSTGAERAAMGARGSAQVVGMFTRNYPSLTSQNLTTDAMTRLLDMDQIYKEHEIGARQSHLTEQIEGLKKNQKYGGMAGYKAPDPRVYQAAALAAGGMPFKTWTTGLSPKEQNDALLLARSVYPDAAAMHPNGQRVPLSQPGNNPGG